MKWAIILAILALFALGAYAIDCNTPYETCIRACCDQCGSTTVTQGGELYCDAGTEGSQLNNCVGAACNPCATSYQQCMQVSGNYDSKKSGVPPSSSSSGCCGSALIMLAALGFIAFRN